MLSGSPGNEVLLRKRLREFNTNTNTDTYTNANTELNTDTWQIQRPGDDLLVHKRLREFSLVAFVFVFCAHAESVHDFKLHFNHTLEETFS